ncbi:MAG: hypothetical protein KGY67_00495 [Candidatus Thermoplasmatota archaeon]|nr:hypothetical protein [Candidatus Thermoplasmatota archaeon]
MGENDSFMAVCEAMGGKYESEFGYLEPDVGGEFLEGRDVGKEWCTFEEMKGLGKNQELIVFNAANTFSIRVKDENLNELFDLWDNDINKSFDKEKQEMMFESTRFSVRIPKGKFRVKTYPLAEFGTPRKIKLNFDD